MDNAIIQLLKENLAERTRLQVEYGEFRSGERVRGFEGSFRGFEAVFDKRLSIEGSMKAYEFPTKVTSDGKLELPDALLRLLPTDQTIRVIVLVSEAASTEEALWSRLTAEQFFAGYSETDAIYDRI